MQAHTRSLLAFALILASMLTACSTAPKADAPANGGAAPSADAQAPKGAADEGSGYTFPLAEPVTMSMFAVIYDIELPQNLAFQKYQEMTNVKWDVQSCMSVDLTEKRNLLLASDQYPDVFFKAGMGQGDCDKYGKQGILVPLNDLIAKHAPNLTQLLADKPFVEQMLTSPDGNIYSLPEIGQQLPDPLIGFLNIKWLKNLGIEEPKSLDEFYNTLKAFKEQDANGNGDPSDEIPYLALNDDSFYYLLPYFGMTPNYGTKTYIQDGKLAYVMTSDLYKDYLLWHKKLFDEGILDSRSFATSGDQRKAMGLSGDVLGFFFDMGSFLTVGRDRDTDYWGLTPFEKGVLPVTTGATTGSMEITDKCKDPGLAVAWADFFYSEEGGRFTWMGVENESYKVNEDGTWEWIMGDFDDLSKLRPAVGLQGHASHPSIQPELWFTGMTDADEKYLNEDRDRLVALGAEPFPALKFSEDELKTLSTIRADIDGYLLQYAAKVVTGKQDLAATWDAYKAELDKMGLTKMMDLYNRAYAAAIAE